MVQCPCGGALRQQVPQDLGAGVCFAPCCDSWLCCVPLLHWGVGWVPRLHAVAPGQIGCCLGLLCCAWWMVTVCGCARLVVRRCACASQVWTHRSCASATGVRRAMHWPNGCKTKRCGSRCSTRTPMTGGWRASMDRMVMWAPGWWGKATPGPCVGTTVRALTRCRKARRARHGEVCLRKRGPSCHAIFVAAMGLVRRGRPRTPHIRADGPCGCR